MKIGSHVQNAGDKMLLGAVEEALSYQANSLMVYLGAPQNTYRKNIDSFNVNRAIKLLLDNNLSSQDIVVHAPYIVNLATDDTKKRQFAIDFLSEEIKLCKAIGSNNFVVHPGSHLNQSLELGLDNISTAIKEILNKTINEDVYILLETMSGKGTECGFRFEQLAYIINKVGSKRVKVCLDTCHIFDAGYDIVNHYDEVIEEFIKIIGLDNLKVIHLNDSKNSLGAKKDRHENIGFGNIGFATLLKVCYDERFIKIPKILETPYIKKNDKEYPPYRYEIEMLKKKTFEPNVFDN